MEDVKNLARFNCLREVSKFLKISWEKALEKMVLCNHEKNKWYETLLSDYNTDWFCFQTINDFFDFTLSGMKKLVKDDVIKDIKTAIDIGAGVGLSTMYIDDNTNIDITYSNIKGKQIDVFRHISKDKNIKIIEKEASEIDEKFDALLCFEFFEHIINPVDAFISLTSKTNAKYVIMQNSFNAFGYGHHREYQFLNGTFSKDCAKKEFLRWVEKTGFKIRKIENSRVLIAERIKVIK